MGVSFKDNELGGRKQVLNEYELVDLMNKLAENNKKLVDDHSEEIIQLKHNIKELLENTESLEKKNKLKDKMRVIGY